MKIFYPVEVFYPSQAGGPANTVYWLTKNLAGCGFEPTIVATDKGISGQVELNRWLATDAGGTIFVKTRFLHVPVHQTLISLRSLLSSEIVHLSSVFFPTAFITAFAARALGKRMAWSPRGELADYSLNYSGRRKRPILWMIRKLIGTYPVFHSTSDDETDDIRRVFGPTARVFQIPNYVELADQALRKDGGYLLYIGRIHPKKAIDNLIRALAASEIFLSSDLVLKIAGKGKDEYQDELKRLVSSLGMDEKIHFVGQVEGDEKRQMLADARFTIMPSHTENFGIVVLESLAQGTPVIASRHTPWQALEAEKVGFWSSNEPGELADTIDRALSMAREQYSEYRERCRGYVVREFEIRSHMDEWLDFYQRVGADV
ncbi:MAG: glycosyltransferase [Pyrinomonadaceae bacterium]